VPGGFAARWRPVLGGRDAEEMARLASAMPAACRAVAPNKAGNNAGAAPSAPPRAVLAAFVADVLDALVRGAQTEPGVSPADTPRHPRGKRRASDPASAIAVDQRWLAALRAPDARVDGTPEELAQLAERLRDWQRPITMAFASPFRLCFRIEEPAAESPGDGAARDATGADAAWFVRYLLQANHDPSLLIPASEAWARSGPGKALLRAEGFDPRSFLLLTLGQAGR